MQISNFCKLGQVLQTQASYPTVEDLGDRIRLYYATKINSASHVFSVDLNPEQPTEILTQPTLVFSPTPNGFDSDGIAPRCIVNGPKKIMYLIGWNRKTSPPYHLSIGAAKWTESSWNKYPGPIMDRAIDEPYFCTSPSVIFEDNLYKMWYCSCTGWEGSEPNYLIRRAESANGLNWQRYPEPCIGYDDFAKAIGWPMVWKNNNQYQMIYSYRGLGDYRTNPATSYRLGFANSKDGKSWEKHDCGLKPSDAGWDSQMIAYTAICRNYIFYNGNGFGETGIGVASYEIR